MTELVQFKANDEVEGLRILGELGQGAASVVYLVQDPRDKQVYALKHVHRGSSKDDRFLQQAVFEYEVASKLNHPNIRRIFRLEKKRKMFVHLNDVFLVMEMLDGVSMDKRPPKSLDDAVTIFMQVADALKHMHAKGFVHADMKPNNVLITRDEQSNVVAKIIDLGQSCTLGTIKPRIQGTPDYIAPEQVHRRAITERTDVYNLGATMYFVLTGKTVPSALAKPDALVSRLDDKMIPKAPPAASLNPEIPARLNELIMHCVEIDSEDRPANMTFVFERLGLILGQIRYRNEQSGSNKAEKAANSSSAAGIAMKKDGSAAGLKVNGGDKPGGAK